MDVKGFARVNAVARDDLGRYSVLDGRVVDCCHLHVHRRDAHKITTATKRTLTLPNQSINHLELEKAVSRALAYGAVERLRGVAVEEATC